MDTAGKKVRKRAKEKPFLPDEIIINILIRLPVKSLVRFGIVCKQWRDITVARDFVDLHQRSSIPFILVASTFKNPSDLFAIDKWWDLARTRSMIHRFPFRGADFPDVYGRLFSHAGLIVLGGLVKPKIRILNPARPSDECVEINISTNFWMTADICAIYYHPSLNEYCSLWRIHKSGQPEPFHYKVLNLGSNPSFKAVCNSFDYIVKDENAYPLFINDHLYWMLKSEQGNKFCGRNDILEFDIISEEFTVIPCPIPLNTECNKHQTHLLNSDGVISFLLILPSTITIWTLKDHVDYLWTATEYTTSIDICDDYDYGVDVIAFVDGKLSFESDYRLIVCNLMEGTVKKYPEWHGGDALFLSHQMSLASLKSCKSILTINEKGEVVV